MGDSDIRHGPDPLKRYSQIKAIPAYQRAYQTWLKVASPTVAHQLATTIGGLTGKTKRAHKNRGLYLAAMRSKDREAFWNGYYSRL